jgi:cytochrome c
VAISATATISVLVMMRPFPFGQDVAKGETSFKKCLICHSIGLGAQNKVGPEQNGLDGRKAGSVPTLVQQWV